MNSEKQTMINVTTTDTIKHIDFLVLSIILMMMTMMRSISIMHVFID